MCRARPTRWRRVAIAIAIQLTTTSEILALPEGPAGATVGDTASPLSGVEASVDVNALTGAAVVGIPIEIPPGRSGMQPSLALSYSSQAGDSPYLGRGWDIAVPRIERSRRNGVPPFTYSAGGVFQYTSNEFVAGDGSGELVEIGIGRYAARVDERHAEYVLTQGPPAVWTMRDASGRRYTFGDVPSARIGPDTFQAAGTFAWYLTRVEDPNGNTVEYIYSQHGGVTYLETVRYGANTAAGGSHLYLVDLVWQLRPAAAATTVSFGAGFRQEFDSVLDRIDVSYSAGAALVRRYDLTWRVSTGSLRPLLSAVQLLGYSDAGSSSYFQRGQGSNLQNAPWSFSYLEASDPVFEAKPTSAVHLPDFRNQACPHDGWPCSKTRDFADLNGDGRPDVVLAGAWTSGDPNWDVYLNQGSTQPFSTSQAWRAPTDKMIQTVHNETESTNGTRVALVDMDRDVRPDLLRWVPGASSWEVYINTGSGFSIVPEYSWVWGLPGDSSRIQRRKTGTNGIGRTEWDLVDLNGDGVADHVGTDNWQVSNPIWDVWWGGGGSNNHSTIWSPVQHIRRTQTPQNGGMRTERDLFDINGDGLPDIVERPPQYPFFIPGQPQVPYVEGNPYWRVWYGTGSGFVGQNGMITPAGDHTAVRWEGEMSPQSNPGCTTFEGDYVCPALPHIRDSEPDNEIDFYLTETIDVTNDGLPDIVDVHRVDVNTVDKWKVRVNTGQGFSDWEHWPTNRPLRKQTSDTQNTGLVWDTFDVNGDGYLDAVHVLAQSETVEVWHGHAANDGVGGYIDGPADGLVWMQNPIGAVTKLEYEVSTRFDTGRVDPAVYDGLPHLPMPVWVVSVLDRENGALQTQYFYDGGYLAPGEREFRGFHEVSTLDLNGLWETSYFHQSPRALAGKRYLKITHLGGSSRTTDGDTLTKQQWSWEVLQVGAREIPRVADTWRMDFSSPSDTPWQPTSPRVTSTSFAYDECGNITSERVRNGFPSGGTQLKLTTSEYYIGQCDLTHRVCTGRCNRVKELRVASGLWKSFTYDARGNLETLKLNGQGDPLTQYHYDTYGNLEWVKDPLLRRTSYAYDAATRIHVTTIVADSDVGGIAETTTRETHPRFGKTTRQVDPSGSQKVYAYDAFGRTTAEAISPQTLSDPTRRFSYRLWPGSPSPVAIQQIDVEEREPNAPTGFRMRSVFLDLLGRTLQVQEARRINGGVATVVLGAVRYPAGGWVTQEYTPVPVGIHPVNTFWDQLAGNGPATVLTYDEFGRVIRRQAPDGSATTTSYKTAWSVRRCDAANVANPAKGMCAEEDHDALDRIVVKRTYLGSSSSWHTLHDFFFEAGGNLEWERQNNDNATRIFYGYDELDRRTAVLNPNSGPWSYHYDKAGNLKCQDDPEPDQHLWFEYDGLHRLVRREQRGGVCINPVGPDPGTLRERAEFEYWTPQNSPPTYAIGRLKAKRAYDDCETSCTLTSQQVFDEYEAHGMPTSSTEEIFDGSVEKRYTTTSTPDDIGRLRETVIPWIGGGEPLEFTYAAQGVLIGVDSEIAGYVNDIWYDVLGRVTRVAQANGVVETYAYRAAQAGGPGYGYQLERIETTGSSGLIRRHWYDAYGVNGHPLRMIDETGTSVTHVLHNSWVATYDNASRLTGWTRVSGTPASGSYEHDELGRLTSKDGKDYDYTGPGPHKVKAINGEPVGYDLNGGMSLLPGNRGAKYDAEGRLVLVCQGPCTGTAPKLAEYRYNADGRRVLARTYGSGGGTTYFFDAFDVREGTITRHISAGGRRIAYTTIAEGELLTGRTEREVLVARAAVGGTSFLILGAVVLLVLPGRRRTRERIPVLAVLMVFAPGQFGVPLAVACVPDPPGPQENTYFYQLDRLGSTDHTTTSAGLPYEHVRYLPYGGVTVLQANGSPKASPSSPFQFTGHRGDDGTALNYFGARYYDPGIGLFTSHDPSGQFFSPYSYAGGNPLDGVDPTGEFALFGIEIPLVKLIIYLAAASAVAATIDALVTGASVGEAFQTGGRTLGISLLFAGPGSQIVGPVIGTLPTIAQYAAAAVLIGYAGYGVYQNFAQGMYASGTLTVAVLGNTLYNAFQSAKAAAEKLIVMRFDQARPKPGGVVDVYVRSFAEQETFGPISFKGDNRTFSTDLNVTARLSAMARVDTGSGEILRTDVFSSPTECASIICAGLFGSKPEVGTPNMDASVSPGGILTMTAAGSNPKVGLSADINITLKLNLQTFEGSLMGDAFPSAEVFVRAPGGFAQMLHKFSTPYDPTSGPATALPGNHQRPMGLFP